MAISTIEYYSNSINKRQFDPSVIIDGMTITVLQDQFHFENEIYYLDDKFVLQVPEIEKESTIQLNIIKESGNKASITAVIVGIDSSNTSFQENKSIMHCLLMGLLPAGIKNLIDGNLNVYLLKLPSNNYHI